MTPNVSDFFLEIEYNVNVPESRCNGDLMVETVVTYKGELINKTLTAITSNQK